MKTEERELAAGVQAIVLLVVSAVAIFFGVPRAIGGIAEGRISSEGGCTSATDYSTITMWKMLFSSRIGDCELANRSFHNTWILRNQTLFLVGLSVIVLVVLAYMLATRGPIGAEDVGRAALVAIIGFGITAVIAVFVLIYLMVIAFAFMIGLVVILGAVSSRK